MPPPPSRTRLLKLKPTHRAVITYYDALNRFTKLGVKYEMAVRSAFQELLDHCARQFDWKLIPEYRIKRKGKADAKVDGALLDSYGLNHGLWEAKDSDDDLEKEIKIKFAIGYPKQNILFWQPECAILYQNGNLFYQADLTKAAELVRVLSLFLEFAPPAIAEWERAVEEFRDKVPQIGFSLKGLIEKERQINKKFIAAFEGFYSLCRSTLNPNISVDAVEEMIIQHILTERIFRRIFSIADFVQRNVIAHEIEVVITALNSRSFSRDDFSRGLEHFYAAIENAAATISSFQEKQTFLNTVYERFFQGFCVKVADTHGIVYTPQPLVSFMIASTDFILRSAFNTSLSDEDVHVLDPFTGTGNFIVNIMRHIPKTALPHKFAEELHCNEVMLLPYYVASMNVEHAYYESTGKYESFEGICLVDTFQTVEKQQGELGFFNEANSARVDRQKKTPIRVVIANPPYNAGQVNENDNNKNRKYPELDHRVSATYGKASKATLLRKLGDPYIKAIRYATDRVGEKGIVCFVNNSSFLTEKTFDGMRRELARDFDLIYILDLGGNVRKNPKLSGTTHNVFGIKLGVSINLFIRLEKKEKESREAKIHYHATGKEWRRQQKYDFLERAASIAGVKWLTLTPDSKNNWITNETDAEFDGFIPIGSKEAKAKGGSGLSIFKTYSLGVSTNRDAVVFDFDPKRLAKRVEQFAEDYNSEVHRWIERGKPANLDEFLRTDRVKWSETLKRHLADAVEAHPTDSSIRSSMYRPFCKMSLFYDDLLIDRPGAFANYFQGESKGLGNRLLSVSLSPERPFCAYCCNIIPSKDVAGGFGSPTYCFPIYTHSRLSGELLENVTSKALAAFREFYADRSIGAEDLFNYVYALLHHPTYRRRYAENLKRELPRIPFVGIPRSEAADPIASFFPSSILQPQRLSSGAPYNPRASAKLFHTFALAGKSLADLHVDFESADEFPLTRKEKHDAKLNWRIESMKLSSDKTTLHYNDFLELGGIPSKAYDYRLGNRSALEWIVDQYRIIRDDDGAIVRDPNCIDDEQYILRLVARIITVSLETMEIIERLPELQVAPIKHRRG